MEYYIREHQDNEAIKKLKSNIPLSHNNIEALEKVLWSELGTKEEYEQEYGSKPLGELVREIVGLDMNAAKAAFSEYLESYNLDSRQIYFVNQIYRSQRRDERPVRASEISVHGPGEHG